MSKLNRMIVVMGLVLGLGAHWTILQSAAWVSMFLKYAQEDSLTVALSKTFDGQHPCSMCIFVRTGKQLEQHADQTLVKVEKLQLLLERPTVFEFVSPGEVVIDTAERCPASRSQAPPSPPPRIA